MEQRCCKCGIGLSVWPKDGLDIARFTDQVRFLRSERPRGLQAVSEAVFRARRRLFSNVNAELTLQMMLLEIRAACRMKAGPER